MFLAGFGFGVEQMKLTVEQIQGSVRQTMEEGWGSSRSPGFGNWIKPEPSDFFIISTHTSGILTSECQSGNLSELVRAMTQDKPC
jgi:hypothetical protein